MGSIGPIQSHGAPRGFSSPITTSIERVSPDDASGEEQKPDPCLIRRAGHDINKSGTEEIPPNERDALGNVPKGGLPTKKGSMQQLTRKDPSPRPYPGGRSGGRRRTVAHYLKTPFDTTLRRTLTNRNNITIMLPMGKEPHPGR